MDNRIESEIAIFTADELRIAAECSTNPEQCRRAASRAIMLVSEIGTPPDIASDYFSKLANKFV